MRKNTNFEQVPLEVVKRVVEEQVKQEETSERANEPRKKSWTGSNNSFWQPARTTATEGVDVFRLERGGARWLESVATLKRAQARAQELAATSPAEYLVVDLKTGDRQIIKLDSAQLTVAAQKPTEETMSGSELKYPEWQAALQELILEFDREKLPGKRQNVEILISKRLQQLRDEMDGLAEVQALNDGLAVLRIIKRDKLDYPD